MVLSDNQPCLFIEHRTSTILNMLEERALPPWALSQADITGLSVPVPELL
jgi:hypothetical protein